MTNSKARVYTCSECQKSFSRTNTLAIHKRTHSGEKPFSCTVCDKVFANLGNMRIHMRIHTGEKPFNCSYCGRSFTQHGSLKAHLRIHTKERPFTCTLCEKSFRVQANLKKHLVVHSNECPFTCEVCNKSFKLKSDLTRHRRNVHSLGRYDTDAIEDSEYIKDEDVTSHTIVSNIQSHGHAKDMSYINLTSMVMPINVGVDAIKEESEWKDIDKKTLEEAPEVYMSTNDFGVKIYKTLVSPSKLKQVKMESEPVESIPSISHYTSSTLDMETLKSVTSIAII